MNKTIVTMMTAAALLGAAPAAQAFCGFYVNSGGSEMFNDATQVVLMRSGTRTVLSMQNNYKGPPEAFALVIPVPTVLQKEDVKTLSKAVFEHVDQMGDGGAGIAADIGHAGLQQRLGDGENALAAESISVAEPEVLDFARERTFGHARLRYMEMHISVRASGQCGLSSQSGC